MLEEAERIAHERRQGDFKNLEVVIQNGIAKAFK